VLASPPLLSCSCAIIFKLILARLIPLCGITILSLLQEIWVDPACGDGVCESPYEFAEYSRFGCRADCGLLKDIHNLTRIRIAINHDFKHPSNSIPAAVRDSF